MMEYTDRMTLRLNVGDHIFEKGSIAKCWVFVTKGIVEIRNCYGVYTIRQGEVIGLLDVMSGSYLFDYVVAEEFTGTVFVLENKDCLAEFYAS